MTPPPSTRTYGPKQPPGIALMGGGWLVTCACRWIKWTADLADAKRAQGKHEAGCKGAPVADTSARVASLPRGRGRK